MAGLVPAIHVYPRGTLLNVDARDKPGHDVVEAAQFRNDGYVASVVTFFLNTFLMLSSNSTFTPLRRMMKLC